MNRYHLLTVLLTLVLVGCGGQTTSQKGASSTKPDGNPAAAKHTGKTPNGDLASTKDDNKQQATGQEDDNKQTKSGNTDTQDKETFDVKVPEEVLALKQGETREVTITVDRKEGFQGDIELSVAKEEKPTLKLTFENPTLEEDQSEAKLTVEANMDSIPGETEIKIQGKSGEKTATAFLRLKVEEGESAGNAKDGQNEDGKTKEPSSKNESSTKDGDE